MDRRRQEVEILRGGGDLQNNAVGNAEMPAKPSYLAQALNMAGVVPGAAGPAGVLPAAMAAGGAGAGPGGTPIGGAPIAGGPVPLTAPNMRYSKLADALLASAAGAKPKGWGDLLNAAGDLALGYTMGNRADEEQKTYKSQLAERLRSITDADSMANTLMSTGDDDLVKQGVAMKVAQAKENAPLRGKDRYMALPNGQVLDLQTMKPVEGMAAKDDKPIEVNGRLVKLNPQTGKYEEVYAAPPNAEGGLYNKNLVFGEDAEGNPVPMQAGSHGEVVRSKLPEGVKLRREPIKMDGGAHWILLDPTTRQVIGQIPKDVAGAAAAGERGKAAGQAQVAMPAAKTTVENAFKTIDQLEKHPGIDVGTGLSSWLHPSAWTPGTDAYNFAVKNRKAQAQSFMGAREALKGAGQVTDFEGARGEAAIAALETAQSKEQYLEELGNLKRMMQASYDDLQRKAGMAAGGGASAQPRSEAPAASPAGGPARIQTQQEYQALPPGTQYIAPDGSTRTKQ